MMPGVGYPQGQTTGVDDGGRTALLVLAALAAVATSTGASAQPYPNKPIRFIVPFPAGGSTDVGARLVGEYLSRVFGQQVYVENKTGANGTIGIETAAKSPPDGYTILVATELGCEQPARLQLECRSLEGPGADHPPVAPADRARRASFARHQHHCRTDCPGEAAAGPALRDRQRGRLTAAHGGAVVCADRRAEDGTGAVSRRRAGDQ